MPTQVCWTPDPIFQPLGVTSPRAPVSSSVQAGLGGGDGSILSCPAPGHGWGRDEEMIESTHLTSLCSLSLCVTSSLPDCGTHSVGIGLYSASVMRIVNARASFPTRCWSRHFLPISWGWEMGLELATPKAEATVWVSKPGGLNMGLDGGPVRTGEG